MTQTVLTMVVTGFVTCLGLVSAVRIFFGVISDS